MTAAGAEAGSDLVPVGPAMPVNAAPNPGPRRRLLRAVTATVLALLAGLAAALLLRNGIRTDDFPSFIDGAPSTPITRYSGPWLTAAAGMALLAALLLLAASMDLVRWSSATGSST